MPMMCTYKVVRMHNAQKLYYYKFYHKKCVEIPAPAYRYLDREDIILGIAYCS